MNKSEKQCVFCKAYLFEDDEVVYCPECGAPHHKTCYFKVGECALKDKHGTAEEYKKPSNNQQTDEQNDTQKPKSNFDDFESGSAPFGFNVPFKAPFNLNNQINGIKIRDIMSFIFFNPFRYIHKFLSLQGGKKTSWNWAAFLFPSQWMMFRKMYKKGLFVLLLSLSSLVFMLPMAAILGEIYSDSAVSLYESLPKMAMAMQSASPAIIIAATIGTFLDLGIRIICALLGDKFYLDHTILKINNLKDQDPDLIKPEFLRKAGGVNPWMGLLAILVLDYLPTVIGSFIL